MAAISEWDRDSDDQSSQLDSEAFFHLRYGEPHPDDVRLLALTADAFKRIAPPRARFDVLDVGTGPSLIPAMCALPRAKTITAWDQDQPNADWLTRELECPILRPQWRQFWDVARTAYGPRHRLPDNPLPELRLKLQPHGASIFELPMATWDVGVMWFCAERFARTRAEFEMACAAFIRAVRPGGSLITAFLTGQPNAAIKRGQVRPALNMSAVQILEIYCAYAGDVEYDVIAVEPREFCCASASFVFVTARAP